MLTRRHAIALLCLLAAVIAAAEPVLARWSIFVYDENGRPIAVRNGAEPPPGSEGQGGPAQGAPDPALRPEERFEAGELVVLDPPEDFAPTVRQLGFTVLEQVSLGALAVRLYRLRIPQGATVAGALQRLRGRFPGLVIDANHVFDPSAAESSPEAVARSLLGWPELSGECGREVRLGMIDGALDLAHPALAGQRIDYRSFHSPPRQPGMAEHGTAIAAMLVGRDPWGGLLPGAELKAANIFEANEAGQASANVIGLMKALDWLTGERVHAVNISLAGAENEAMRRVVQRAREKGLVMVAAAGNWGRADRPAYPAAYEQVLAITAIDGARGIYSYANQGRYIDFAAPGVGIWTAVPGGGKAQSGTSFAAPYVTVLLAIENARAGAPGLSVLQERLRAHAVDLGPEGRDDTFGWGLVDLARSCPG